jgi:hypothetical protein
MGLANEIDRGQSKHKPYEGLPATGDLPLSGLEAASSENITRYDNEGFDIRI